MVTKEILRAGRAPFSAVVLLVLTKGPAAGDVGFQAPREQVLAVPGVAAAFVSEKEPQGASGWSAEAGERGLFSIAGLSLSQLRVGYRERGWGSVLSVAWLRTPVGYAVTAEVEPFVGSMDRWLLTTSLRARRVAVVGTFPSQSVSASLGAAIVLGPGFVIGYRAERIRVAGGGNDGVETRLYAATGWRSRVTGTATLAMDREGRVAATIASTVDVVPCVRLGFGYRDVSAEIRSFIAIRVRRYRIAAGLAHHPVLGVTRDVFVGWNCGW